MAAARLEHPVAILRTECWHAGLSQTVFIATLFCLQLIMLRLSLPLVI